MKRILITGANSYIGEAVREYLQREPDRYTVEVADTLTLDPVPETFRGYDAVFNVAGIAHVRETDKNRHLYYEVNRDLVLRIAKGAKEAGVGQFILLSTMSVYGMTTGHITKQTPVRPANAYGESKAMADEALTQLADEKFLFCCLRPPMVYGKGCKGNYQSLRSFALKSPLFPDYDNERSMIYIGNLCAFVKDCIDKEASGLFFPQNAEYMNTSRMVAQIAAAHHKKIRLTKLFNWAINIFRIGVVKKVFGTLTYEKTDLVDLFGTEESLLLTEE